MKKTGPREIQKERESITELLDWLDMSSEQGLLHEESAHRAGSVCERILILPLIAAITAACFGQSVSPSPS